MNAGRAQPDRPRPPSARAGPCPSWAVWSRGRRRSGRTARERPRGRGTSLCASTRCTKRVERGTDAGTARRGPIRAGRAAVACSSPDTCRPPGCGRGLPRRCGRNARGRSRAPTRFRGAAALRGRGDRPVRSKRALPVRRRRTTPAAGPRTGRPGRDGELGARGPTPVPPRSRGSRPPSGRRRSPPRPPEGPPPPLRSGAPRSPRPARRIGARVRRGASDRRSEPRWERRRGASVA